MRIAQARGWTQDCTLVQIEVHHLFTSATIFLLCVRRLRPSQRNFTKILPRRRTSHVVSHKRYWEGSHKFGALAHMVLLPSNCLQLCFDTFTTTIFLYGHCNVIYKCPLRYFNRGKKSKKQQISDETQGRLARTEKPLNNFSTPFHGNGWMDCQPLILIVHPLIATKRNMLCDKN